MLIAVTVNIKDKVHSSMQSCLHEKLEKFKKPCSSELINSANHTTDHSSNLHATNTQHIQWFFYQEKQHFPTDNDMQSYLNWRAMEYEMASTMWFVVRLTCSNVSADPAKGELIMSLLPPAQLETLSGTTVVETGTNDTCCGADLVFRESEHQSEHQAYRVSEYSLLKQKHAPRIILLYVSGHVCVAIYTHDKVGIFDSRGLSCKSDLFKAFKKALVPYYKHKNIKMQDFVSFNEHLDLQGAGDWYCQTWIYYFAYRHLVLEEAPSLIMRSLDQLMHEKNTKGLCQEVLRFKRWLVDVSQTLTVDSLQVGSLSLNPLAKNMNSFLPYNYKASSSRSFQRHSSQKHVLMLDDKDFQVFEEHLAPAKQVMQALRQHMTNLSPCHNDNVNEQ